MKAKHRICRFVASVACRRANRCLNNFEKNVDFFRQTDATSKNYLNSITTLKPTISSLSKREAL